MSELIYGGHCDDVQDGRIVAALTEALMLPPKELIKVNVNQAQATGASSCCPKPLAFPVYDIEASRVFDGSGILIAVMSTFACTCIICIDILVAVTRRLGRCR